jgi:hypothetical protein
MRGAVGDIPTTAQRYGQGLFLTGTAQAGHGGTMTGYAAEVVLDHGRADPVGVVVLTNTDGNPHALLTAALTGSPYTLTPSPDAASPAPRTLTDADAARYVGTYRNPRRFTVEVVRTGAALTLKRFGRDFPMRALETPGRFQVDLPRGGTETIAFGLTPDGRADYLQMNIWALARVPDAK